MTNEEMRILGDEDVLVRRGELLRDLMVSRFQLRTGQLEDTSRLKKMRRDLARFNTELRRREVAQELTRGALLNRSVVVASSGSGVSLPVAGSDPQLKSRSRLGALRDRLLGRQP